MQNSNYGGGGLNLDFKYPLPNLNKRIFFRKLLTHPFWKILFDMRIVAI